MMPLSALVSVDHDRYARTLFQYQTDNPLVVNGTLESLKQLMLEEDVCYKGIHWDSSARAYYS